MQPKARATCIMSTPPTGPPKVLEGVLQGIYDKWAQKYAMFYQQAEDIDENFAAGQQQQGKRCDTE